MRKAAWAALVLVAAGCAAPSEIGPRLLTARAGIGIGDQRLVVDFVDRGNGRSVSEADIPVVATLRDRNGSPLATVEGEFVQLTPDGSGAYAFSVHLAEVARYQLTFTLGDTTGIGPLGVEAWERVPQIAVGQDAPRSVTRTSPPEDLSSLTSDPSPLPRLYESTVADAVTAGPAVVLFGSSRHCLSGFCGQALDLVKTLAGEFPDLGFVHVETVADPFQAPGEELDYVDAVLEWGLVAEPSIFVVDADGVVVAYFEVGVAPDELRSTVESLAP